MSKPLLSVKDNQAFILDRPIMRGGMSAALDQIDILRQSNRPHLLVTANIDHVIDLHDGSVLVGAYEEASLRVVDGTPLLWTLRMLGAKGLKRVTGADLISEVSESSIERGWRVVISGGSERVLRAAADNLSRRFPGAEILAVPMPYLESAEDEKGALVVHQLLECRPDVVFLCLGAPKQESWFLNWKEQLPPAVYIGAGAAVDFAAGEKRRAPRIFQKIGLEWIWRLLQEFGRLAPRYLVKGPRFIVIAVNSFKDRYFRTQQRESSR